MVRRLPPAGSFEISIAMRPAFSALLLSLALCPAPAGLAEPASSSVVHPAPAPGWRDMLREYSRLSDGHTDCGARFPGFDPEMARLGEAFALTAYPANPDLGRRNFKRLALRLNLSTPTGGTRHKIFTPNKEPWPGYKGEVDSGGLAHFVFNTGTLPMPLFDHPVVRIVLKSPVSRGRVQPAAQVAVRIIRADAMDISVVEHDAAVRAALVSKIRKQFDAEHASEPMSDDEAKCLSDCLPYLT